MSRLSIILVLLGSLQGCVNYKPDLEQGTSLTEQHVSQLRANLSKEEVISVLGRPTLEPIINSSTLNYTYWNLPSNKRRHSPSYKQLNLYFKNNKLVAYSGDWDIKNLTKKNETR